MRRRVIGLVLVLIFVASACGGSSRSPLLAEGRDLYTGKGCVACHGGVGEGATGPSLHDVAATFPRCETHLEWVRLGAQRWIEVHGNTYGESSKPVELGVMPSTEDSMTDDERRTVVAYERVEFGGIAEEAVRVDCGI